MIKIPCEIYTRCVGYFRPVSSFNPGKKEEFRERKTYIIPESVKRNEYKLSGEVL